uniref:Ig-like domain-containing protein n=1 Tax=Cyprinus carpio TaxID=7962 RepID=A0A8C1Y6B6_CYPCA
CFCSECVFGESVSVMEGDSVTLHTDLTEIHEDDDILWKFGAEDSLIAEINRGDQIFSTFKGADGRFKDRLKLDKQTGSLTITDITTELAGVYELQISGDIYFSQNLSSSSSQQNCSLVCSVVNVGHVTLSWYKGNSLLSSISVSDLSISLSLPLEVEYQDKNTYSCVLNNPISNQTQHLDITQLCTGMIGVNVRDYLTYLKSDRLFLFITDQGLPVFQIVLISAAGSLLIVAAVVIFCIYRKCTKTGEEFNYYLQTLTTIHSFQSDIQITIYKTANFAVLTHL